MALQVWCVCSSCTLLPLCLLHFAPALCLVVSLRRRAGEPEWHGSPCDGGDRWSAPRRRGADARHRPPRRGNVSRAAQGRDRALPRPTCLCNAPARPFPAAFRSPLLYSSSAAETFTENREPIRKSNETRFGTTPRFALLGVDITSTSCN